jgi:hypothetical protein
VLEEGRDDFDFKNDSLGLCEPHIRQQSGKRFRSATLSACIYKKIKLLDDCSLFQDRMLSVNSTWGMVQG